MHCKTEQRFFFFSMRKEEQSLEKTAVPVTAYDR